MSKEVLIEQIARGAANDWCRCFKCDKKLRDCNNTDCMKPNATCNQWYHAYRGALLALEDKRVESIFKKED